MVINNKYTEAKKNLGGPRSRTTRGHDKEEHDFHCDVYVGAYSDVPDAADTDPKFELDTDKILL